MTRLILTVIALSIAVGIAAAFAQLGQPAPMVPYSQPGGSMLGLGGPMIPNAGAGSGPTPPVGCAAGKLDFSDLTGCQIAWAGH